MQETTTISRQEARKLETRQQIQDAARLLIAEHGYEKTTMRMLAKAAGVGLGTIALHFKDKQSLLLASFYDHIGALSMEAIESAPYDAPIRERLLSVVSALYGFYDTQSLYLRPVVREALFIQGEWRERFDAQIEECMGLMIPFFEVAKERGEVNPDVESLHAAMVCWSLYVNVLIDGLNAENFDAELQLAKFTPLLDLALKGIAS